MIRHCRQTKSSPRAICSIGQEIHERVLGRNDSQRVRHHGEELPILCHAGVSSSRQGYRVIDASGRSAWSGKHPPGGYRPAEGPSASHCGRWQEGAAVWPQLAVAAVALVTRERHGRRKVVPMSVAEPVFGTLVPSRYNRIVPIPDHTDVLLFNAATGALARVDLSIRKALTDGDVCGLPDSTVNQLRTGGFLVSTDLDEVSRVAYDTYCLWYSGTAANIVVAPTMKCNFACTYCFQSEQRDDTTMGEKVWQQTTDFVKRLSRDVSSISLNWFGGEPLLAMDIVRSTTREMVNFARDRRICLKSMLATNGYLMTPSVTDELVDLGIEAVQVTLDGPQEDHDSRRRLLQGGGSFHKIMDNLRYAASTPIRIVIRSNVDQLNASRLGLLYEDLVRQGVLGTGRSMFYVARTEPHCGYRHCMSESTFTDFYSSWYEARQQRPGLFPRVPSPLDVCMARRPKSFAIDPAGRLYKCVEALGVVEESVGSVQDEVMQVSPLLQRWTSLDPFSVEECRECIMLPYCRGGCAYKWIRDGRPHCRWGLSYLDASVTAFSEMHGAHPQRKSSGENAAEPGESVRPGIDSIDGGIR